MVRARFRCPPISFVLRSITSASPTTNRTKINYADFENNDELIGHIDVGAFLILPVPDLADDVNAAIELKAFSPSRDDERQMFGKAMGELKVKAWRDPDEVGTNSGLKSRNVCAAVEKSHDYTKIRSRQAKSLSSRC